MNSSSNTSIILHSFSFVNHTFKISFCQLLELFDPVQRLIFRCFDHVDAENERIQLDVSILIDCVCRLFDNNVFVIDYWNSSRMTSIVTKWCCSKSFVRTSWDGRTNRFRKSRFNVSISWRSTFILFNRLFWSPNRQYSTFS